MSRTLSTREAHITTGCLALPAAVDCSNDSELADSTFYLKHKIATKREGRTQKEAAREDTIFSKKHNGNGTHAHTVVYQIN